jgi:hypothetical protein
MKVKKQITRWLSFPTASLSRLLELTRPHCSKSARQTARDQTKSCRHSRPDSKPPPLCLIYWVPRRLSEAFLSKDSVQPPSLSSSLPPTLSCRPTRPNPPSPGSRRAMSSLSHSQSNQEITPQTMSPPLTVFIILWLHGTTTGQHPPRPRAQRRPQVP